MSSTNHNIGEYTTEEAASLVGDISPARVRQIAKAELEETVDFKRFGRTIVITDSGLERIRNRNTKPGPAAKRAIGGKKK